MTLKTKLNNNLIKPLWTNGTNKKRGQLNSTTSISNIFERTKENWKMLPNKRTRFVFIFLSNGLSRAICHSDLSLRAVSIFVLWYLQKYTQNVYLFLLFTSSHQDLLLKGNIKQREKEMFLYGFAMKTWFVIFLFSDSYASEAWRYICCFLFILFNQVYGIWSEWRRAEFRYYFTQTYISIPLTGSCSV